MDGVQVKPLTVGFHENQFLDKLNGENKLGFWFQLGDEEREEVGSPWGPSNPQTLNRYSYVLNNPLKCTDPSGHHPIIRAIVQLFQWLARVGRAGGAQATSRVASQAANRATHEAYKNYLRQAMQKPLVKDASLQKLFNNLYRDNARIGSGSTAAAIRHELSTGGIVGGRTHIQKGVDYVKALDRWLRNNPNASPGDRAAAENVIADIIDALKTRPGDPLP